ncbi:hypothetical protein BDEG_26146 [Batrachochytrium dendrobatidis JEL423]|uniref:RING-type domain-containing protein n=1 Tax=Batrachochytrium dendrobatidis (strain JEL423) TaxID=403673 RepID=A0A177WRH0_BATDL|nr:hypothetical protein BDEG_26146 [Batrachochytrium dendrobatidis JEL423]
MGNQLSNGRSSQQQENGSNQEQRTLQSGTASTTRARQTRMLRRQMLPVNPLVPTSVLRFLGLPPHDNEPSAVPQSHHNELEHRDDMDGVLSHDHQPDPVQESFVSSHPRHSDAVGSITGVRQRRSMRPLLAARQSRIDMRSVANTVSESMQSFPADAPLDANTVEGSLGLNDQFPLETGIDTNTSQGSTPGLAAASSNAISTDMDTTTDLHASPIINQSTEHGDTSDMMDQPEIEDGNESNRNQDSTTSPRQERGQVLDGTLQSLLTSILSSLPPHLIPGAVIQSEHAPSTQDIPSQTSLPNITQSDSRPARRPPLVILALRALSTDTASSDSPATAPEQRTDSANDSNSATAPQGTSNETVDGTPTEHVSIPTPWMVYVMSQSGALLMRMGNQGADPSAAEMPLTAPLPDGADSQERRPVFGPIQPPSTATQPSDNVAASDASSTQPYFNPFSMFANSMLSGTRNSSGSATSPTLPSHELPGQSLLSPEFLGSGSAASDRTNTAPTGGSIPIPSPFGPNDRQGLANLALPFALSLIMRTTRANSGLRDAQPSTSTDPQQSATNDTTTHSDTIPRGVDEQSSNQAHSGGDDQRGLSDDEAGENEQATPRASRTRSLPGLGDAGTTPGSMIRSLLLQTLLGAALSGLGPSLDGGILGSTGDGANRDGTGDAQSDATDTNAQRRSQGLDYDMLLQLGEMLGPARRMNAQQSDVDEHIPMIVYKHADALLPRVFANTGVEFDPMPESTSTDTIVAESLGVDESTDHSDLKSLLVSKPIDYGVQHLLGETHEKCTICLTPYEEDDELRILSCRHGFHKTCLDQWLVSYRNSCPICRSKGVASSNAPDATTNDTTVGQGAAGGRDGSRSELPNAILFLLS